MFRDFLKFFENLYFYFKVIIGKFIRTTKLRNYILY